MNPAVTRAIAAIPEKAWTTIRYPRAALGRAGATVALRSTGRRDQLHRVHLGTQEVAGHLPARRAPRPAAVTPPATAGQDELFTTWRHHGFVTNSTLSTVAADETHRDHAIIEQVIAELKNGPLAHAPSGKFAANAAWLALACLAFNVLRAAGAAASPRHAKARWATLRTHLVAIPARIASSARRLVLHLPTTGPGRPPGKTSGPPPRQPDRPAQSAPRKRPHVEEPDRPATSPTPSQPRRRRITVDNVNNQPPKSPSVDQG